MIRSFICTLPVMLLAEPYIIWFEDYNGSGDESIGHYMLTCEENGFLQVGETYDYLNYII